VCLRVLVCVVVLGAAACEETLDPVRFLAPVDSGSDATSSLDAGGEDAGPMDSGELDAGLVDAAASDASSGD